MKKEQRNDLIIIIISALLLVAANVCERVLELPLWGYLLIYLVPYFISGSGTLKETAENIIHGEIFDECFLMTVATVGALAIGFLPGCENEFSEAVFVMLFFRLGEFFEELAEGRSRRSIKHLVDIKSEFARVKTDSGTTEISPEEVKVGDILVIFAGEKIPLDGVVLSGSSSLSTVALTGESLPADIKAGDTVLSGCVNLSAVIEIRVTKAYGEDTASKIISLIEEASETKSEREDFITKFAKIYTPVVVFAAIAISFIPPLFASDYLSGLLAWLPKGLTFLVVSCPCALVISVPLSYFCGIGAASRVGVLIKGGKYIDALAALDVAVFDKTGTLTKGAFSVSAVHPEGMSERELLHIASHAESFSNHPIARSVVEGYGEECKECSVEDLHEVAGKGVKAEVSGRSVAVGNDALMSDSGASHGDCRHSGTVVHIAVDGKYAGHIALSDTLKADAAEGIRELGKCGVSKVVMLTGDSAENAREIAETLSIDECHSKLLPEDKVKITASLKSQLRRGKTLAFVGDGINDAPVLASADVGIAMGGLGSDAAIEAADVVIMDDSPMGVSRAVKIAKKTRKKVTVNVCFSIGCKLAVLILAAFGLTGMYLAVFADVGVTLICILNALSLNLKK